MRILIITQKVDKDASDLGFFHAWIKHFAKNFESVIVICLQKGEHDLPPNVKVVSLGKERGVSKFGYVRNFLSTIIKERKNYDAVFVHMNQIYVVLGGLFWRTWKKPVFLWYVHKQISLSLRIAEKLATKIFTASKESFRLKSSKVKIVGHGIDTEIFNSVSKNRDGIIRLVTLGRISPVKNIGLMIDLVSEIKKFGKDANLTIIGDPGSPDQTKHLEDLKERVKMGNLSETVIFVPGVPQKDLPKLLAGKDIFLNFSNTGSLDKAVIEARLTGLFVITTNEAFKGFGRGVVFSDKPDLQPLVEAVENLASAPEDQSDDLTLLEKSFSLSSLIERLSLIIKQHGY